MNLVWLGANNALACRACPLLLISPALPSDGSALLVWGML